MGSPTPSLEQELNEQEQLEKEFERAAAIDSENQSESEGSHDDDDGDDAELDDEIQDNDSAKKRRKSSRRRKQEQQEKVPNVSLMVENYFNPTEAKQLASEILSIFLDLKHFSRLMIICFFVCFRFGWNIESITNVR